MGGIFLWFLLLGWAGCSVLEEIRRPVVQKQSCDSRIFGFAILRRQETIKKWFCCLYIAHGATDVGVSAGKAKPNYHDFFPLKGVVSWVSKSRGFSYSFMPNTNTSGENHIYKKRSERSGKQDKFRFLPAGQLTNHDASLASKQLLRSQVVGFYRGGSKAVSSAASPLDVGRGSWCNTLLDNKPMIFALPVHYLPCNKTTFTSGINLLEIKVQLLYLFCIKSVVLRL